jgi:hypothetical protein
MYVIVSFMMVFVVWNPSGRSEEQPISVIIRWGGLYHREHTVV